MQTAVGVFLRQNTNIEARIDAHRSLNDQLKLRDSEASVACLKHNLLSILSAIEQDLSRSDEQLISVALRTVSYFLHHPDLSERTPQQLGKRLMKFIVELVAHSTDSSVITLSLWCIHMQRCPELIASLTDRALIAIGSRLTTESQSLPIETEALHAATTIVMQFPQMGQQLVDGAAQSSVLFSLFVRVVKEGTIDALDAVVQLFEQLLRIQPRVAMGKIWASAEVDLTELMDGLLRLMPSKNRTVAIRAWKCLIRIIPPECVAQPGFLNPLLKVPKQCFVGHRMSMRHEGYICWKSLIEVLGEITAWEATPNIFPLLLLPIERAFQPEKGSSSVCRMAAVDALLAVCMRSSVSTTSLFYQGLSKLLRQFLQVDETIEDCWEGCTGVLRVIACCLTPSRLLCTASDEYWQEVCERAVTEEAGLFSTSEASDELDMDVARTAIDQAGGLPQYLKAHSALLLEALTVIRTKLTRSDDTQQPHISRILSLAQHVCRQRARFIWACLVSSPSFDASQCDMNQAVASQLSQCMGGSQPDMSYSNPPTDSIDVIHLLMSEFKAMNPTPSSTSIDFPVNMMLLESVTWISCRCNAFAFGIDGASDNWQEWILAMSKTLIDYDPPMPSALPSTVIAPAVSILEVQIIALLAVHGACDESSKLYDLEYVKALCHDCSAVILKAGALPNLLRVFHSLVPTPSMEIRAKHDREELPMPLQRSMVLLQTLWTDVMAMLSSMASTELGDIDESTRQATVAGLQEVCWLPFRVYCWTSGEALRHFFSDSASTKEWLHVMVVWAKEQASAHVVRFLAALQTSVGSIERVENASQAHNHVLECAAIIDIAKHGLDVLSACTAIEDESCVALLALFHQLYGCAPSVPTGQNCVDVIKAMCKLLLYRQRTGNESSSLLVSMQEWLGRCIHDMTLSQDATVEEIGGSDCRQHAVSVLTTLASVATAARLETCALVKSSLTALLQKLLAAEKTSSNAALRATARQFYLDIYHEELPFDSRSHPLPSAVKQEQPPQSFESDCRKRSPDTSPAKESSNNALLDALATLASTKSSHSFTHIAQANLQTPTFDSADEDTLSGRYLKVYDSQSSTSDSETKRRKTVPAKTPSSSDGSEPARDEALHSDAEHVHGLATEPGRRAVLLQLMDAVAREIDDWDGQQAECLEEAVTLWSDVLQKLWKLRDVHHPPQR